MGYQMKLLIDTSPASMVELIKEDLVLGQLITPLTGYSDAGLPYGIDNGAFTRFNKKEFTRMIDRNNESERSERLRRTLVRLYLI